KNNDVQFDFDTQGIEMYVDTDGFVKAKGTTLGADNGIGVATIMTVLESQDMVHPPIEALFTIDEETGMTGAIGLDETILQGEILLNLDTEEDDELTMGCAGGLDVTATKSYSVENLSGNFGSLKVDVKGLKGGHSGGDIHLGLGNSNKILARFLNESLEFKGQITSMNSGSLRNAIPREGHFIVTIPTSEIENVKSAFENLKNNIYIEFQSVEPNLKIEISEVELNNSVASFEETKKFT